MKPEFKIHIKNFTDRKLCEVVASARYLGSLHDEAVACMEELAFRRVNGSLFDYENCILEEEKKLPDFKNFDVNKKLKIGGGLGFLKGLKIV